MKILSVDTSSKLCNIAILEDSKLLKEISLDNGLTHSESLMPMIKNIFENLNITLQDIDLLVCDKGPGSFTGIRIGVATLKAFADSLNKQCIGISSLETLAYNVKEDGIICCLIDAKKNNCYYGIYKKEKEKIDLIGELSIDSIQNIISKLSTINNTITFVGDGALNYKEIITEKLPNSRFIESNDLSAYNLGLVGLNHYNKKIYDDILPLYLRKSQAEQMMEEGKKHGN